MPTSSNDYNIGFNDYNTGGVDRSFSEFNNTARTVAIVSSVTSILLVVIIAMVICYVCKNRRKIGKEIVNEVREITAPLPPSNIIPIWEADAPTMEKFFHELAQEKPVRFTAPQLYTFTSNYSKILGSGGFGKVYEGEFPNGVKIAVKVLNMTANKPNVEQQFMAEVGTIGRVHHINLVRLYGFCYDQFISALVYEYMENGSLDKHLFDENHPLQWEELHKIALATAKGITYLHEECDKRIIHYDIKPENVLLDASFTPKVADFGLAKLCSRDDTHVSLNGYRGTPGYSAPELRLHNYPITYKCDVYSFGMLMFEIVGRRRNSGGQSSGGSIDWFPKTVWKEWKKGELDALVEGCGVEEKDKCKAERMCKAALWCVQDAPEERPHMSTVVKMLEGGMEIPPPPKPFKYWSQNLPSGSNLLGGSGSVSSTTTSSIRMYEITVATV